MIDNGSRSCNFYYVLFLRVAINKMSANLHYYLNRLTSQKYGFKEQL